MSQLRKPSRSSSSSTCYLVITTSTSACSSSRSFKVEGRPGRRGSCGSGCWQELMTLAGIS